MSNAQGIGAPKGARVHWFLLNLPKYVAYNYNFNYDENKHAYFVWRRWWHCSENNFRYADFYTVVQTSARCWRVMAHSNLTGETVYRSCKTSTDAGKVIATYARYWHDSREWKEDRQQIQKIIKEGKEKWQ